MKSMHVLFTIAISLLLAACTSTQINQFSTFAQAGNAYSDAMFELVDETGNVAIDKDTSLLISTRRDLPTGERKKAILENTKLVKIQLKILGDLKMHTFLLKKYFLTLAQLAGSNADETIGTAATNLVTELGKISPKLMDAKIGSASVAQFVENAVPISVRHFRKEALNKHLTRERAGAMERELELQRALLTLLSEKIGEDLFIVLQSRETNEIAKPYIADGGLPNGWAANRKVVLSHTVSLASANNAAAAAASLKTAFRSLVSDSVSPKDFDALFSDINEMIDLVELVKSGTE